MTISTERTLIQSLFLELTRAPRHSFPVDGYELEAGDGQGVYVIYGPEKEVLHVGCTYRGKRGLRQRLRNHLQAASSFVDKHFENDGSRLRQGCTYQFLVVDEIRTRILLEAYAVGNLCPVHVGSHQLLSTAP